MSMQRHFLIFLFLLSCASMNAGVTTVSGRLLGAYNNITNTNGIGAGRVIYLQDDQFQYMSTNPSTYTNTFTNCGVINRVSLKYQESERRFYATPWTLSVVCTLKKWGPTGTAITPDEVFTLSIDYDPAAGTVYTDKSLYIATSPGYRNQVIVGTVTPGGSISAVPVDVMLECEIEVSRSYVFNQSTVPTAANYAPVFPPTGDATMNIYWNFMPGAEEYDLEFVHVSAYDAVSIATPDFSRATRITTPDQDYTINLPYDNGFIVYRVRGVGRDCGNTTFRREGVWSASSSQISVYNLDGNRNWQYSAAYAEDGKRKEVVTFFDGTGKTRQAVTLNNSVDVAVVGETFYDYEGRAAIQTLPAPQAARSHTLKFYEQFSINNTTSLPYHRKDFDNDQLYSGSTCSWTAPPGLKNTEGASNYYSSANVDNAVGYNAAIPDAQLYPFVQTLYGRDGRTTLQTAPGTDHKTGSGHETEMFYTGVTQEKLDRLFGNEVGYAEHYNQVAVKDPNGQLSVSYVDLSGRTIATALVGGAPSSVDALPSNGITNITESYNNVNVYDQSQQAYIVNEYYLVNDVSSNYSFSYTMTPQQFNALCTDSLHKCQYDMLITIYDNCDNPVADNEVSHVVGTSYVIDKAVLAGNFNKTFTVTFPRVGVYRIQKKLSINQAALQAAVLAFQADLPGDCVTPLDSLEELYDLNVDLSECESCDDNCIQLALAAGLSSGTTAYNNFVDSCQTHDCVDASYELGDCEGLYDIFAADMRPGGQYYDDAYAGNTGAPDDNWLTTYVWADASTASWTSADFRDPANVLIDTWAEMRTYWQPGWETKMFASAVSGKNKLVEFHPEYCHYTWCARIDTSRQYDVALNGSNTYTFVIANTTGVPYLNLANNPVGLNILNADPYFTGTGPGTGDYNSMLGQLNNYGGPGVTMWAYAGTLAGCTACDQQWIVFRTLYITEKARLMRARQITNGCGFLCENSQPPDFVADNCSAAGTVGFMIRVPDIINEINLLQANANSEQTNFTTNSSTTYDICKTAASGYICVTNTNPAPLTVATVITINGVTITASGTGIAAFGANSLATALVASINSHVSNPDYTAVIDPANANCFTIWGPAYLGANGNLGIAYTSQTGVTLTLPAGNALSGGSNSGGCPPLEHCFCKEMAAIAAFYNGTNPTTSTYNVSHTTYATAEDYILYVLNQTYGTSVTLANVQAWRTSCTNSSNASPTQSPAPALPAALDCANPTIPCEEDGYDISHFWALQEYNAQVAAATQDFMAEYIAKCFAGINEDFTVTHPDREYHFTLYYYDQAGNLVRTVPPAGVKMLNATQVGQSMDYRDGVPLSTRTVPTHTRATNTMVTNYKYNTFSNLVESASPDGGTSIFFYDKVGRVVASQDAKQAAASGGSNYYYSYTLYDPQSRIKEAGQVSKSAALTSTTAADYAAFETWVTTTSTRTQVASTYYDDVVSGNNITTFLTQTYLRKRVVMSTLEETFDGNANTYDHATHYSYDVHGNVSTLVQEFPEWSDLGQRYKKMTYTYDLISGNVNEVKYQEGSGDQFFHRYYYDADNRITNAYTSRDGIVWEQDAKYLYYLHGPVARTETGDVKVQGSDYAYTIHGWLKGVNTNVLDRTKDLGKDGQDPTNGSYISARTGLHSDIATDAFGFALGYYWNTTSGQPKDYVPINSSAQSIYSDATALTNTTDDMFNGNIKEMSTALSKGNTGGLPTALGLMFNRYRYDQLNRIKSSNSFTGVSTTSYTAYTNTSEFYNTFTYDANGNIQTQYRNGNSGSGLSMDDLDYYYYKSTGGIYSMNADGTVPVDATNKLAYVDDQGAPGNYLDDIEAQLSGNYTYDAIGQLTGDASELIQTIDWTINHKIKSVSRTTGTTTKDDLVFEYDATGQRVMKLSKQRDLTGVKTQNNWAYTYYVRDATGNVMATYERTFTELSATQVKDKLQLDETHLYGSARLGVINRAPDNVYSEVTWNYNAINVDKSYHTTTIAGTTAMAAPNMGTPVRKLGRKTYELSNHLGNVLVTISDRKLLKQQGSTSTIDYFMADVVSTSDYSAFGAPMPGRNFSSSSYRYGFNGKENDGETSTQDYGFRIYNARLGRFLSVDPLTRNYPMLTPYQYASNSPVWCIDIDGLEGTPANFKAQQKQMGKDIKTALVLNNASTTELVIAEYLNGINGFIATSLDGAVTLVTDPTALLNTNAVTMAESIVESAKKFDGTASRIVESYHRTGSLRESALNGDISKMVEMETGVVVAALSVGVVIEGVFLRSSLLPEVVVRPSGIQPGMTALEVEQAAAAMRSSGQAPSTVSAAVAPNGTTVIQPSAAPPTTIAPQLVNAAKPFGGVGAEFGDITVGACSEFQAANKLLLENPTLQLNQIRISGAIRPRTMQIVPRCEVCSGMFGEEIIH